MCGPCPVLKVLPWHLPYNWGKSRKTSVRLAEKCHLARTRDRHLVSADVCQVVRLAGSQHQLTSSRISRLEIWYGRRSRGLPNHRELPVTNVPGCIGSNTRTLGLQQLQFLDMGASGGPPNGARVVHHGTDLLLIHQNTIPDGETASPIQEGSQRSQPLCRLLSHLIDMFRPG